MKMEKDRLSPEKPDHYIHEFSVLVQVDPQILTSSPLHLGNFSLLCLVLPCLAPWYVEGPTGSLARYLGR